MRKYFYYKQDKLKPEGVKVEKTEPEILDSYWDIWYDKTPIQISKKYLLGRITRN